jgi:putative FmdB family regulatory protein
MPLYEYYCESCESYSEEIFKSSEKPTTIDCANCGRAGAEYRVGKPAMFRIKFDQGGRIGYKMDMGNGKKVHRSATREAYEHNIGSKSYKDAKESKTDLNRSVYTKEYGREVEKKEKQKAEKFAKGLKEALKNVD